MDNSQQYTAGEMEINSELIIKAKEALTTNNGEKLTHSGNWPLLLKGLEDMNVKSLKYTATPCGYSPHERPLDVYLEYGIINLDKPCNPSSHEVVSWIKSILRCERTGHSGTLDPMVSGCLPVCLNKATRVAKCQQDAGKEYIAVVKFEKDVTKQQFIDAMNLYVGPLLQRPPEQCAVKRNLRIRKVHEVEYLDFDEKKQLGMFRVACEAGTYIRSLCTHLGLHLGVKSEMVDLRRSRSGVVTESNLVTMHDVLDAKYLYDQKRDESYLRAIVQPLESLLVAYPRIIIKDSCINSICYGGQLTAKGILRYGDFNHKDTVLLVSPKGEAVALGVALVTSPQLSMMEHGIVCRTKKVIMSKDTYQRQWKLGPQAHKNEEEREEQESATEKKHSENKVESHASKSHEKKEKRKGSDEREGSFLKKSKKEFS
ncbi:H/ACA ribonucleoprotein complex subunit 4 [Nematocida minor]|uniref:H/ACA ribonucleoprotein complex subunit 4 n=1 Tax=Nematocida minor TaxID=1912983 RepID=UPI0022207F5B|nr:H/ACA ribonucleoprotein complex subunit 4 [Nematocida minor]KAI5191774.1 H/ACA ribonucleoprotein complex subunit 4 [Nematocida minor]